VSSAGFSVGLSSLLLARDTGDPVECYYLVFAALVMGLVCFSEERYTRTSLTFFTKILTSFALVVQSLVEEQASE
jgi:hypothetical protein